LNRGSQSAAFALATEKRLDRRFLNRRPAAAAAAVGALD
jgi:hypothetical protein